MRATITGALLVGALGLSGCVSTQTLQNAAPTITALANAGCSGSLTVNAGAQTAAGISPGGAHGDITFTGACDPSKAKPGSTPAAPP